MRKAAIFSIKFIFSVGLLYLALGKVDFPALIARLDSRSLKWLSLAIAVIFLQLFIGALRWREISRFCEAPLSTIQATRFAVIGAFFNQTLPSSIGGDAVRLVLVSRAGAGWRAAGYSVFIDRAVGLIALATIVVVSLPWSYQLIQNVDGRTTVTAIDALALGAGVGFLLFSKLTWPRLKTWRVTRHVYACSVIANRILFDRKTVPSVAGLTFIIHALTVATVWCVAQSISLPVSYATLFLLIPPVLLISMLPISIAGWGVRETAMMVAFGYAGLPESDGVNVSLLFGAATFVAGAAGGVIWLLSSEKRLQLLPTSH
jgi:uncharacterized membrane protein YbhN (UPF0104 family)